MKFNNLDIIKIMFNGQEIKSTIFNASELLIIKTLIENFDGDLTKFDYTTGIVINNADNTVHLQSSIGNHLNVALFTKLKNIRAIEFKVKSGTLAGVRIAIGQDKNNFCFVPITGTTYNSVTSGVVDATAIGVTQSDTITVQANDIIKGVVQGRNIQMFKNDVLFGTALVNTMNATPTLTKETLIGGIAWRDVANDYYVDWIKVYKNTLTKYMHLSIDDVRICMKDIVTNNYSSIWQNPTFAFFKGLHDVYGITVTFNLFYRFDDGSWDLSMFPSKYMDEFAQCSSWLKFAFHAYDYNCNYTTDSSNALNHYNLVMSNVARFAGVNSWDKIPRVHNYSGDVTACRAWRDTQNGVIGFLTADDSRTPNMYLNARQIASLTYCDSFKDNAENLYNVFTDMRIENETDPIAKLNTRITTASYQGNNDILEIFTHEVLLDTTMQTKITNIVQWAINNSYRFDFSQNNIPLA